MLASIIMLTIFEVILLKFSVIERENVVKRYQGGESVFALCSELNVSRSTIYNWIKEHGISSSKSDGTPITAKAVHLLEKRVKKLEAELEIWKRCGCTLDSPLQEKLVAIEKLVPEFGVHAPCRVLGVLRSTYYHRALRSPEQTMIEKENELFQPVIRKIFEDTQGRLGAKKIRVIMMTQGYTISPERISRLMKEMGLVCTSAQKGIRYNFVPKGRYYRNRLKREFQQEHPNQAWVSDITMLYVNYERYYLCVIIDLFSRKVIAHEIDNNQEAPIVEKAFQVAYQVRGPSKGLLFHSDQGGQYTAYKFRKLLRTLGVKQSFSAPGCPYDNAVAEAFFRTLKAEEVSRRQYQSESELRTSIDEYINFFNHTRPHQRFQYRTPNQVELDYYNT